MSIEPCHQNRKDTSTGSDWAGAAGNFSESSGGGTRRERPGRPKRTPARRCAGPGPADAPFRSGGGGTGERTASRRARSPPPSPPRRSRATDSPKPQPTTPPTPRGLPRFPTRQVPGGVAPAPGANLGREHGGDRGPGPSATRKLAGYLPRGGRRRSSPAGAPASQGRKVKEKQRSPRPGRSRRPVRPPPAGGSAPAPRGHSARAR